ncbi:MAG: hypothetical protein AB8B70_02605 [Prochlorococcus sp.]
MPQDDLPKPASTVLVSTSAHLFEDWADPALMIDAPDCPVPLINTT